ncbi:MAG: Rpn family recombination-promoting nuclease/putative transposase [Lachnospiraceae bacterium]|nr:Rpn family recombination-promoting nuclease/putative transposase [Lachnospiraceae bacterium]
MGRKNEENKDKVVLMKVDFAFKYVMRNEKVVRGFLSAVLGISQTEIKTIEYLDTNTEKKRENEKLGILDLLVLLNGNKKVNIEIQIPYQRFWNNRMLFYICEEYVSGHRKGYGFTDEEIPDVVSVCILDFVYFENNPYVYNHFAIYNSKTNERLTEKIDINMIELGKLSRVSAEEEQEYTELIKWARFISATTWEEYERLGMEDESMAEAVKELRKINEVDMEYERYIRREIARRDAYQIKENERAYKEMIEQQKQIIMQNQLENQKGKEELEKSREEIKNLKLELEMLKEKYHKELEKENHA